MCAPVGTIGDSPMATASVPEEITASTLADRYLEDLFAIYEASDLDAVDELLEAGCSVADDILEEYDKDLEEWPTVQYNPLRTGATYDPTADVLMIRKPRETPPGGYGLIDERGQSVLNVLASGFLASYNQQLVDEYFEENVSAANHIHDHETKTLLPGIDAAFSAIFGYAIDADVTDAEARDAYLEAWMEYYESGGVNVRRFEVVTSTLCQRIDEADGPGIERMRHALAIQEPLIRRGDLSAVAAGR
jgi:hypothetical protein